jgi:hypothetical protein
MFIVEWLRLFCRLCSSFLLGIAHGRNMGIKL